MPTITALQRFKKLKKLKELDMAQQIDIPDILDICLADKQTKRLAACTPGQRIRVTAGTIWLTVSANKHPCTAGDLFLTEGQTYRLEHGGDAVIEAIGGAARAQLARAVDGSTQKRNALAIWQLLWRFHQNRRHWLVWNKNIDPCADTAGVLVAGAQLRSQS